MNISTYQILDRTPSSLENFVNGVIRKEIVRNTIQQKVNTIVQQIQLRRAEELSNSGCDSFSVSIMISSEQNHFTLLLDRFWRESRYHHICSKSPCFFFSSANRTYLKRVTEIVRRKVINRFNSDISFRFSASRISKANIGWNIWYGLLALTGVVFPPMVCTFGGHAWNGCWYHFKIIAQPTKCEYSGSSDDDI